MSEVTKQDLLEMETRITNHTKKDILSAVEVLITGMGIRFGEVNKRLDRMDATLNLHAKQLAAGTKAIAGFSEWVGKADADYQHVLSELTDLKIRMGKLETKSLLS